MKKIKWATHKSLFGQIATSACLLGGSAGLIFGISAGTFKVEYLSMGSSQARLLAANATNYFSQNINSQWNMFQKGNPSKEGYIPEYPQPLWQEFNKDDGLKWWEELHGTHEEGFYRPDEAWNKVDPSKMGLAKQPDDPNNPLTSDEAAMRKNYGTLVIDGATHTALDRSFNQSLFNGIANFNSNIHHTNINENEVKFYKPSQDSTQEFINVYREAAKNSRILCLAGFNHVTPLNALGEQKGSKVDFGADNYVKNAGMLLIDGDISNNQNMASVLFRSDQPAFLTGLATCIYFMNNLGLYHENYRDISVAAYGGTPIPTVTIYMGGFQRGIEFFNHFILRDKILASFRSYITDPSKQPERYVKAIIEHSKYRAEIEAGRPMEAEKAYEYSKKLYDEYSIKMIKLGEFGSHFSGSFASGDAIGISKQLLNRGASAIIAVAGPQPLDTAQEIMNQKKNCIVVGVDCPLEDSDYQKPFTNPNFYDKTVAYDGSKSSQAQNIIKFSAVKDMNSVSEKILRLAAEGKNWDVTNTRPWKSAQPIPEYEKKDVFPLESIAIIEVGADKFDIVGTSGAQIPSLPTVLEIPTELTISGVKRKLNSIRKVTDQEKIEHPEFRSFDYSSLKSIKTLKFVGTKNDKFTIGDRAFDYTDVQKSFMTNAGIQYIDMSSLDVNNIIVGTRPFAGIIADKDSRCYKRGVIKLDSNTNNGTAEDFFKKLFPDAQPECDWAVIEADPYKSICTFGFKTCGNIENGLISISWDGWAYLIEALNLIECFDAEGQIPGANVTFLELWKVCANAYLNELIGQGMKDTDPIYIFVDGQKDATIEKMVTFDRNSDYYKHYSHTMAILGRTLNRAQMMFPNTMTVLTGKDGKPYIPAGTTPLTILQWLKENMYFTV